VSSPFVAHGHAGADRPAPHGGPVSVSSELWSYDVAGGSAEREQRVEPLVVNVPVCRFDRVGSAPDRVENCSARDVVEQQAREIIETPLRNTTRITVTSSRLAGIG